MTERSSSRSLTRTSRRAGLFSLGGALVLLIGGCSSPEDLSAANDGAPAANLLKTPAPVFEDDTRHRAATTGAASTGAASHRAGADASARGASRSKEDGAWNGDGALPQTGLQATTARVPSRDEALASLGVRKTPSADHPSQEHPASGHAAPKRSAGAAGTAVSEARSAPTAPSAGAAEALDTIFQGYLERFRAAPPGNGGFEAIERADLEAKLVALFFLRDRRNLEDYRDLIRSFREEGPVHVELELLRAALYQRIGQPDLRDRAVTRAASASVPAAGAFSIQEMAFARDIRGYRSYTPRVGDEFQAGEEVLLYAEFAAFQNTPAAKADGTSGHRRSFAADFVMRKADGSEVERRPLFRAGQAVEVADETSKPVHFWGRYPISARLAPGAYRLEVEANDLEGQRRTRASLPLRVAGNVPISGRP